MNEDLKPFKKGEVVYVRKAKFADPQPAVGVVFVLFNPVRNQSIRVAEAYGQVWRMWPSNKAPKPAPEAKNAKIEKQYKEYLAENPLARRKTKPTKQNPFKGVAK